LRNIFPAEFVPSEFIIENDKSSVMKLNKEWHLAHPMPKNPSFEQRVKWHLEHQKHCGCRKITGKLAEEMRKRGIKF